MTSVPAGFLEAALAALETIGARTAEELNEFGLDASVAETLSQTVTTS
jgi:hypothetical protein